MNTSEYIELVDISEHWCGVGDIGDLLNTSLMFSQYLKVFVVFCIMYYVQYININSSSGLTNIASTN